MALEFKNKGNAALQQKDYTKAVEYYSQGIQLEENEVLYSNRCAAYLALGKFEEAVKDAEKAVSIKPSWSRGYLRKGQALHGLNRLEEAEQALNKCLELEPANPQASKALNDVKQALETQTNSGGGAFNLFSPQTLMQLAKNPKIAAYLQDPEFMKILTQIQQNPQLIGQYSSDPRITELFTEMINAQGGGAFAQQTQSKGDDADDAMAAKKEEEEKMKREQEELKKKKEAEEQNKKKEQEEVKNPEAEAEKNKGNELYRKKKFDEALVHYNNAVQMDPDNMVYRLNRAAVYLEMDKIDECIKQCEEALEVGRSTKAHFSNIAKAYARIGSAHMKAERYDEAIKYFTESLTEHRVKEVAAKLTKAQNAKRKKEEQEYINPERAEEEKQKGNEAFKKQDFPTAVQHYREAIKRNPNNHLYYSNLASAYVKLGEFGYGLKNYEKSLEIDPKFVKAYKGKGMCHQFMKEFHKALEAFESGLAIDPENQELKLARGQLMMEINTQQPDEERIRRAQQDPEIRSILQDPVMMNVLNDLKSNPSSAMKHLANPEVKNKLEKLIAAGIIQTK